MRKENILQPQHPLHKDSTCWCSQVLISDLASQIGSIHDNCLQRSGCLARDVAAMNNKNGSLQTEKYEIPANKLRAIQTGRKFIRFMAIVCGNTSIGRNMLQL